MISRAFTDCRNFTIQDPEGNYLVRANSNWFFFDTEHGVPVRVGEEDIRGYGVGQEEKLSMDYAPRRIPLPAEYEEYPVIAVAAHHIDTNHHVNNAQYVEIAREVLPAGLLIRELRVEYKKAAVLGDQIIPRVSVEEGCYTIALLRYRRKALRSCMAADRRYCTRVGIF